MTKKTFAIILSLLVAIMPFLGFPEQFDTYFYLITGLLLAGLIELISIQYYARYNLFQQEDDVDELDVYEEETVEVKNQNFQNGFQDDEKERYEDQAYNTEVEEEHATQTTKRKRAQ